MVEVGDFEFDPVKVVAYGNDDTLCPHFSLFSVVFTVTVVVIIVVAVILFVGVVDHLLEKQVAHTNPLWDITLSTRHSDFVLAAELNQHSDRSCIDSLSEFCSLFAPQIGITLGLVFHDHRGTHGEHCSIRHGEHCSIRRVSVAEPRLVALRPPCSGPALVGQHYAP